MILSSSSTSGMPTPRTACTRMPWPRGRSPSSSIPPMPSRTRSRRRGPTSAGSRVSARRLLSSFALLLGLAGCAKVLPPPREAIPANAQRAIDLLQARWQAFDDLRTQAALAVERQGTRQRLSGVLLARRPSSVRFEALAPFGAPFLFLSVADGQLKAY